jgi:hypothetical protein
LQTDAGSRAAKVRRIGCGVVICRLGIARSREARQKQSARAQVDAEEVGREGEMFAGLGLRMRRGRAKAKR